MSEAKRKSYYKSKRREYAFDKDRKAWYFTIVSDPQKVAYCYAGPIFAYPSCATPVMMDLETYKLCKPGAQMFKYQDFLELRKTVLQLWTAKGLKDQLARGWNEVQDAANKIFEKKFGSVIETHNDVIAKLLTSKQICGF